MRPLAEMRIPEGLVGLAFDVDDTITKGGHIEACALEALHGLRAMTSLRLVAVTGRPLGWAEVLARILPVDLAIGENGAGWFYARDGRACEGYFLGESERASLLALHARVRKRVAEELTYVREASVARLRRYDLAFDVNEEESLDDEQRAALERVIRSEGAEPITSSVHCHASTGAWDKAKGITQAALDAFGQFDPGSWIFIGDSGNDAPAFGHFALSVGVANVRKHDLPAGPRFVTKSERGAGFAELSAHIIDSQVAPVL